MRARRVHDGGALARAEEERRDRTPRPGGGCKFRRPVGCLLAVRPGEAAANSGIVRPTTVHELSIAHDLVDSASAAALKAGARRVTVVHVDLGMLSGVVKDALLFGYDIAAKETPLEGSRLAVRELPVVIFCATCGQERELPGVQSIRCPICGQPSHDVRQGKELSIVALEIETDDV
jgi:hydrogenase nickel incorporation protein HypA/HybF